MSGFSYIGEVQFSMTEATCHYSLGEPHHEGNEGQFSISSCQEGQVNSTQQRKYHSLVTGS